jgi:hypothetical protein
MGCLVSDDGSMAICGNFNKLVEERPKDWIDTGYKILRDYPFNWREKIGGIECTCEQVEEHYQPYYGFNFFHIGRCALIKLIEKRPQLKNLPCYARLPHICAID